MSDGKEVARVLLERWGIRVEPEMSKYVLRQLERGLHRAMPDLPVIGGDARTGVPIRHAVPLEALRAAMASQLPA